MRWRLWECKYMELSGELTYACSTSEKDHGRMKKRLCRMLRAHSWREGRGDAASTTKKGLSTKTGEGFCNCLLESTSTQILSWRLLSLDRKDT